MRKIWMMSAANIRKSKGQAVGMLILMLMSAMFLYMGLVMCEEILFSTNVMAAVWRVYVPNAHFNELRTQFSANRYLNVQNT